MESVIFLSFSRFSWQLAMILIVVFFFFKHKTAYELRISDWSSDVCSSDLNPTAKDQQCAHRRAIGHWRFHSRDRAVRIDRSPPRRSTAHLHSPNPPV